MLSPFFLLRLELLDHVYVQVPWSLQDPQGVSPEHLIFRRRHVSQACRVLGALLVGRSGVCPLATVEVISGCKSLMPRGEMQVWGI
jgi:hypothetical protein